MTWLKAFADEPEIERWMERAKCLDEPTDFFFPESPGGIGALQVRAAVAFCADCPVSAECLDYAMRHREEYGVWGGTTGPQRKRMWRGRKR